MPLKDVELPLRATVEAMAGLLCDSIESGAPVLYAHSEDADLRQAPCRAVEAHGSARGLDLVAMPFPGRVLVARRPGSRKGVPHAA